MRRRCEWCSRYMATDAPTTRWRSKDADSEWNDHEKALCPSCRRAARWASPHWVALPDRVDAQ